MGQQIIYPINEIFYSIQGEGYHAGKAAIFIRFAGCNLNCEWCDTDHSEKMKLTIPQIFYEITNNFSRKPEFEKDPYFIVLTGGEPTIYDLSYLLRAFKRRLPSHTIALETNGTKPEILGTLKELNLLDWITISPKLEKPKFASLKYADEIKVVYDGIINPWDYGDAHKHLYIQPCSENFQPAIDFVLKNPQWRLSIQMQKVLKIK